MLSRIHAFTVAPLVRAAHWLTLHRLPLGAWQQIVSCGTSSGPPFSPLGPGWDPLWTRFFTTRHGANLATTKTNAF